MRHILRLLPIVSAVAICIAQEHPVDHGGSKPEVVFETDRPFSSLGPQSFNRFDKSCVQPLERIGSQLRLEHAKSIYELMGAPVRLRIRQYSDRWKSTREVEHRLESVLKAKTDIVFGSVPWAEGVNRDLVVTIEFADKTRAVLEASGWHVCFVDHSGHASWVTIPLNK